MEFWIFTAALLAGLFGIIRAIQRVKRIHNERGRVAFNHDYIAVRWT